VSLLRLVLVVAPAVVLTGAVGAWQLSRHPPPRLDVAPSPVVTAATLTVPVPAAAPRVEAGGQATVSRAWVARTSRATGVPAPALRAYGAATLLVAEASPGCDLGWTTLAGIGWVESHHGTIGGRRLRADGTSSRPIFGPVLDGTRDVAAIPGAGGRWQRAGGAMQFLPASWARWASDGDGDGVRDRQDIDDAAYAAARYLCASGADLTTGPAWTSAIRSYNHSDAYVLAVHDVAEAYAARSG